jgi:TRAP-type C4-dicarboxylate transport system substrate-binding protein
MKKTCKKWLALALSACMMGIFLTACGGGSSAPTSPAASGPEPATSAPAATPSGDTAKLDFGPYTPEKPLVLKFGHYGTGDIHPSNIIANEMKTKLAERSGGAVQMEIFGDGILGFDVALCESVMNGTLDFASNNPFMMAAYAQPLQVLDIHFLFDDIDHVRNYYSSEVYGKVNGLTESLNVLTLGQQWLGFRVTSTRDKEVHTVGDLNGLRLRMSTSDLFVKYFTAYGAVPISMAPDEFVPALQQGVVDGTDLTTSIQWQSNYHQYQKVFSLTNHWAQWNLLNTPLDKFNSYPEDVQELIRSVSQEACLNSVDIMEKANADAIPLLEKDGVKIVSDVDIDGFRAAAQPVTDEWLANNDRTIYDAIRALV